MPRRNYSKNSQKTQKSSRNPRISKPEFVDWYISLRMVQKLAF